MTILTSRFEKSLPLQEERDGFRIVRVPVAFRVSKGVVMPSRTFILPPFGGTGKHWTSTRSGPQVVTRTGSRFVVTTSL